MDEKLRLKVAECARMLELLGMFDFSGHVSARVPGTDLLYINSQTANRCDLSPEDILLVDMEGKVVEGAGKAPQETPIHTELYRQRPEVLSVAHVHPPETVALSISGKQFKAVTFRAAVFHKGVPVYNECRHINSRERAGEMVRVMGGARAVMLRGHGATVATESVESCFLACVYFEDNNRKFLKAYQTGNEPIEISQEEMDEGKNSLWQEKTFKKIWSYYKAKLNVEF